MSNKRKEVVSISEQHSETLKNFSNSSGVSENEALELMIEEEVLNVNQDKRLLIDLLESCKELMASEQGEPVIVH